MTQPGKDHGGYDRRPKGVNGTLPEALIAKPEPIILLGLQGLSHHFRTGLGRRQSRRALGEFLESHWWLEGPALPVPSRVSRRPSASPQGDRKRTRSRLHRVPAVWLRPEGPHETICPDPRGASRVPSHHHTGPVRIVSHPRRQTPARRQWPSRPDPMQTPLQPRLLLSASRPLLTE